MGGDAVGRLFAGHRWCFAGFALVDAFHNASMILGGMGPVDPLRSAATRSFAALCDLHSGITFPGAVQVFVAPVMHRMRHVLLLEQR